MTFLVEILLPLNDADGNAFPASLYEELAQKLTERFGGVTSFSRSPADGRWRNQGDTEHDDIIVLEIMTQELHRPWWSQLRAQLVRSFAQDDVVIRSHKVERLT